MGIKISQFVPMAGTIGGFLLLILTGFKEIDFSLEAHYIWTYMGITIGATVAHKATKKWRTTKNE